MKVVVVGPGAMGCLIACRLAAGCQNTNHQIALLDHRPDRAARLNKRGLRLITENGEESISLPVLSHPQALADADLVIFCVKSYTLPKVLDSCQSWLAAGSLLIFLQNGISHLQSIEGLIGKAVPVFGTTTEGATLVEEGTVRHAGKGITSLGFAHKPARQMQHKLDAFALVLGQSGIETQITEDIIARIWTKLLINVGINGLTVRYGCLNGELLQREEALRMMETLVAEGQAVAKACQISIPANIFTLTCDICRKTASNVSSMLQDIRAGRKTEIDAINGTLVEQGRATGIATPANEALVEYITTKEKEFSQTNQYHSP